MTVTTFIKKLCLQNGRTVATCSSLSSIRYEGNSKQQKYFITHCSKSHQDHYQSCRLSKLYLIKDKIYRTTTTEAGPNKDELEKHYSFY